MVFLLSLILTNKLLYNQTSTLYEKSVLVLCNVTVEKSNDLWDASSRDVEHAVG